MERVRKSEIILEKYKLLSQEYQKQGKDFQSKHDSIKEREKIKISEIKKNFETHFAGMRSQIKEDQKAMLNEEGEVSIVKENEELESKYQDLMKEIDEKVNLMAKNETE